MSLWKVTSLDCASDSPGMDIAAATAILLSSDLAEIIRIVGYSSIAGLIVYLLIGKIEFGA